MPRRQGVLVSRQGRGRHANARSAGIWAKVPISYGERRPKSMKWTLVGGGAFQKLLTGPDTGPGGPGRATP